MERNFRDLIERHWADRKFVCVGLDTEVSKLPKARGRKNVGKRMFEFNQRIVEVTNDIVCAYKVNVAFYEGRGKDGYVALKQTIEFILENAPTVPVILDAKRGDIGNTNAGYVRAAFDELEADAITVNPYMGGKTLEPFFFRQDKFVFVLCRTSNEGSDEFQNLQVDGKPLYLYVAKNFAEKWNGKGNCGLVTGATYPNELALVRETAPTLPLLIPGIGAQGGDLEATVKAGKDANGGGMIINSSRGIIFDPDPRKKALELDEQIKSFL